MKRFAFLFIAAALSAAGGVDPRADGKQLAQDFINSYGKNIEDTLGDPLVSDKPITTPSGDTFSAQILCSTPPVLPFMQMNVSGSGDFSFSVKMDKDLNGGFESSYNFSGISGVCANGVVKCDAGSWNHCDYYAWRFTGSLSLSPVTVNNVGGCFCTNNSCGGLITTEHDHILDTLGSGVLAVVSPTNTNYIISKRMIDAGVLNVWAQDYTGCPNMSGNTPPGYNEQDDSALKTRVFAEVGAGNAQYELVGKTLDAYNNELNTRECAIRNSVGFTSTGTLKNTHNDTCTYAADPDCTLDTEIIYDADGQGLYTVRDGASTGVTPATSCKDILRDGITYTACADGAAISYYDSTGGSGFLYSSGGGAKSWWKTTRRYICKEPQGNNFDDIKERSTTAKESADYDGTTLTFDSKTRDAATGSWTTTHESAAVQLHDVNESTKYCEVEWMQVQNDVFSDGTQREDTNVDNQIKKREIRECVNDWTVCPLNAGETMKHDCGAIDDFYEAVSELSAVNELSKDMACTAP